MATDLDSTMAADTEGLVFITVTHQSKQHVLTLPKDATITDLSIAIQENLQVPPANQKITISKLPMLKYPFKDPNLPISSIPGNSVKLIGSTAKEATAISTAQEEASRRVNPRAGRPNVQNVSAYKTVDHKRAQEEAQYTFLDLKPLPYLPNPSKSLEFLIKLKNDRGIKASMRKHKFTVPLLTEMNPVEHTQSNHEGTSRTLGLNRNRGEVIELRLRTDAYDGYRDYKTIRNTLCHELAHNVHGPHDRNFWDLCKQIEKEVNAESGGGRTFGEREEYYDGGHGEDMDDHGGWSGGEFVVGGGTGGAGGLSRREVLAKAAEERMKRLREQQGGSEGSGSGS
jgi:hypothetical protein